MRRRSGFTLVELLVATALILFIMSILSAAFVAGMKSVSDFKAAGDMADKQRNVMTVLRRDLWADHFPGRQMMSQPDFWTGGPPAEGYFRIFQGAPDVNEGLDLDNLPSYRQTTTSLAFTVRLRGNDRGNFFSAVVPPTIQDNGNPVPNPLLASALLGSPDRRFQDTAGVYSSQWAEVAYFLVPTGETAEGTPLFGLYRRQLLTVTDNSLVTTNDPAQPYIPIAQAVDAAGNNQYLEMSTKLDLPSNGNMYFNSAKDLTMPIRRFGMDPTLPPPQTPPPATPPPPPPNFAGLFKAAYGGGYPTMSQENVNYVLANNAPLNSNYAAADLLLTDVVSFDVRVLVAGAPQSFDLFDLTTSTPGNPFFPVNNPTFAPTNPANPNNVRVFDTWSAYSDDVADYSQWSIPGSAASIPIMNDNNGQPIRILALQITLRVYDNTKTKKTRQVTLIQDM
jgi:prepilin-type N-terminal cleavage/methylation domain-containing protein